MQFRSSVASFGICSLLLALRLLPDPVFKDDILVAAEERERQLIKSHLKHIMELFIAMIDS